MTDAEAAELASTRKALNQAINDYQKAVEDAKRWMAAYNEASQQVLEVKEKLRQTEVKQYSMRIENVQLASTVARLRRAIVNICVDNDDDI